MGTVSPPIVCRQWLGIGMGMGNLRGLWVQVPDGYGCRYDATVPVTRLAGYLYLSG
jgi:hypothetical protein